MPRSLAGLGETASAGRPPAVQCPARGTGTPALPGTHPEIFPVRYRFPLANRPVMATANRLPMHHPSRGVFGRIRTELIPLGPPSPAFRAPIAFPSPHRPGPTEAVLPFHWRPVSEQVYA